MTDNFKTEMVGFGQAPPKQAKPTARKPRAPKSGKEREKDSTLPRKKKGNREYMALMESVLADARGTGGKGGGKGKPGKVDEELPKQNKGDTSKLSVMESIFGKANAEPDSTLMGRQPGKGSRRNEVIPTEESTQKYVGFLAEMTVGAAFSDKPRPPRPTGG